MTVDLGSTPVSSNKTHKTADIWKRKGNKKFLCIITSLRFCTNVDSKFNCNRLRRVEVVEVKGHTLTKSRTLVSKQRPQPLRSVKRSHCDVWSRNLLSSVSLTTQTFPKYPVVDFLGNIVDCILPTGPTFCVLVNFP